MINRKILAFYSPYNGAGKSTAAKILEDNMTIILSFADPIRRCAEYINSYFVNINMLSDEKNESFDEFGGKSLQDFLIYFNQAGRNFYSNIWVDVLQREIQWHKDEVDIIVDDLRFPNEYKMLKEEGAKIIRITNPEREIIKTETEALLEDYNFDYELINYKHNIEEYRTQLNEITRRYIKL